MTVEGWMVDLRGLWRWRICFRWREGGAEEVEIVDYH
jgi:hypothetical protein